ncbi:MAG TPA: hypothetical protein VF041_09195 [Gemmatimonadaceae bacterium]
MIALTSHTTARRAMVGPSPESRGTRPGLALPVTLVALTIVGTIVAGLLFATSLERRDGADAIRRVRALAAAEYGPPFLLAPGAWPSPWSITPARGVVGTREYRSGDGSIDSVVVLKLGLSTFLIASRGTSGAGALMARHRIGILADSRPPALHAAAPVAVAEGVSIAGGSSVAAADSAADGWECPPSADLPPAAAVALPPDAALDSSGCGAGGCLGGAVRRDSAAAVSASFEHPGELDVGALLALARVLPAGATITSAAPSSSARAACDTTSIRNLGDPSPRPVGDTGAHPCDGWLPVVRSAGTLRLVGGAGQGVLLVDGDLWLERGAAFAGVALVRGTIHLSGGASLAGAVIAARASLDGGSRIHYSSCAIARALVAAAAPEPARSYAWMELY